MAQAAYDLNHFAPSRRQHKPPVRVAKKARRQRSERAVQVWKMVRTLLGVMVLVGLVSAVLYTQAAITEVTTDIADAKQNLKEEEALYTYLSFELDNKTSLKNIEEAAAEMGLAKPDSSQIRYFRVEDGTSIHVRENAITTLLNNTKNGLLSILDYLVP